MTERWVQISTQILDQLKSLEEVEKKDRLELVRSMRFTLRALEMSLVGWKQWVNNLEIMTKFPIEDLEKMSRKLSELTQSFLEYDLEATKLGNRIGLETVKKVKRSRKPKTKTSYVA